MKVFIQYAISLVCYVPTIFGRYSTVSTGQDSDFMWGVATAAYQIEGAATADGRGESIWDEFSKLPNRTKNEENGDTADWSYYLYNVDTQLIKDLGVKYYRFSISWSRILPNGTGQINQAGIDHYNSVINALVAAGISPIVTLYHWDLPLSLDKHHGGWLNPDMETFFVEYASICFAEFGDRVKYWITVNEPWTFTLNGYVSGVHAPGRCSNRHRCTHGNSSLEGYIAAHNVLNAHAAVVEYYRKVYKKHKHGQIGITLNIDWSYPYTSSPADVAAAQRRNEFTFAWFADPIFFGEYPKSMRELVGGRLPEFTPQQSSRIKGSVDYIGFNHYSSRFVSDISDRTTTSSESEDGSGWFDDQRLYAGSTGTLIGPQGGSDWLNMVPDGMYQSLMWVTRRYNKPTIIITENGCDILHEGDTPFPEVLQDQYRIDYLSSYIDEVFRARRDGADIRGYMAWSLLDNFEWSDGYSKRFGLYYVDYTDPNRTRHAKNSALWYRSRVTRPVAIETDGSDSVAAPADYDNVTVVDSSYPVNDGHLNGIWTNWLRLLYESYRKAFTVRTRIGPHLGVP